MGDDEKRRLRDEVADLSQAVKDLRAQLAVQAGHHCCQGWHSCCGSLHWHGCGHVPYTQPYTVTYPQYQTIGASTTTAAPMPNTTLTYGNTAGAAPSALGTISYS